MNLSILRVSIQRSEIYLEFLIMIFLKSIEVSEKLMKRKNIKRSFLALSVASTFMFGAAVQADEFDDIRWSLDRSNSPSQDRDGSGRTPGTGNRTNDQGTFQFEISTTRTNTLQRQEWQFERRSNYHRFTGQFRISSDRPDFDRVSVAQTHDDQTGSEGVFSIYQVRRDGDDYVFGVQGDTTEASNQYRIFSTVDIELDTWYQLRTSTLSSTRDGSVEVAELSRNGRVIWSETVRGGGENEQYKKAGAYRLTNGTGRVIVDWRRMTFDTGRRR